MTIDDDCLRPKNNNLTLVRLVLASAVIWTHSYWRVTGVSSVDHFSPWLGVPISQFAVDGFFFISGFLVYASLLRRHQVGEFVAARLARLWPALAVSVLVSTTIGWFLTQADGWSYLTGPTLKFIAYNLSLITGAFHLTGVHCGAEPCVINGSLWTIPWEVGCYATLTILALLGLASPRAMKRLILPATLIFIVVMHVPGVPELIERHAGHGLAYALGLADRLWAAFALGIACFVWRDRIRLSWLHTLALLAAVMATTAYGVTVPHLDQLLIASAVINLGFLTARRGSISASWPDYSYGMYVYAFPVMMVVAALLPDLPAEGLALITGALTVIPAALSWHLVEKPVLDLFRTQRKRARPAADADETRAVRIGLLWHSPNSGNLGVGALTVAHMDLIDKAARRIGVQPHYTILGFVDPGTASYVTHPNTTIVPLNGRALLPGGSYGKALRNLDIVLDIGGGDSFAEIYGAKRFAYLLITKLLARLRGVPLVLAPQTIGPFERQPYRALATAIMKSAEAVVARDPTSFDAARSMSARIKLLQAVDVAFALPYAPPPARGDGKLRIGINASGLLFNRGYSGANEFGMELDYADFTRRLIARLLAEPDAEVWLLSHVNSDTLSMDDDRAVAALLRKEFPEARLAPVFTSPGEAKSFIAGLDFLVAGRMHACIAAYSAGVPVVPIAYSRKFPGLFTALLGYEHMVPVTGMGTEAALAYTLGRLHDRDRLRADIADGTKLAQDMLGVYEDALAGLLTEVTQTQPSASPGKEAAHRVERTA